MPLNRKSENTLRRDVHWRGALKKKAQNKGRKTRICVG
jgi:hypothetical protein